MDAEFALKKPAIPAGLLTFIFKTVYAAFVVCPTRSLNRLIISLLKAGMSSGLRLLTQFLSRSTSLSSQLPPALRISSWTVGQLVILWPFTRPAETSSQG